MLRRASLLLLLALGACGDDGACAMDEWMLDEAIREAQVSAILAAKGTTNRQEIACEDLCAAAGGWEDPAAMTITFCTMELSDTPGADAEAIVGQVQCAGVHECD